MEVRPTLTTIVLYKQWKFENSQEKLKSSLWIPSLTQTVIFNLTQVFY